MEFDERLGWIDRGTPGVRGGAQVRDLQREVKIYESFAINSRHVGRGFEWCGLSGRERAREVHSHLVFYASMFPNDRLTAIEALRDDHPESAAYYARKAVWRRLALLAPYIPILRAGDAKRRADHQMLHHYEADYGL